MLPANERTTIPESVAAWLESYGNLAVAKILTSHGQVGGARIVHLTPAQGDWLTDLIDRCLPDILDKPLLWGMARRWVMRVRSPEPPEWAVRV